MDKQRQKYKGLLDMIDGGGANAVGNEFQGGGLLSVIANAIATPYGSEDRAEEAAGLLGNTRPQMRPNRPASIAPAAIPAPYSSAPPTDAQRFGMNPPAPYSASPVNVGSPPSYTQPYSMQTPINYDDGSGMTPANNYVDSFASDSFSYNGNRDDGITGLIPTKTNRYDFVDNLPDDAKDFKNINLQGSGMTPDSNYPDPRQRFASQLVEMIGPDAAENLMRSGMGEQAYQAFVANNYNMPNY